VIRASVLVIALASLAAACGSGVEDVTEALSPGATVSPTASPTPSLAPTADPSASGRAAAEAPIVVETPAPGDEVGSPVTIAGSADVFEATVSIRILDANGQELAAGFTTATCGSGCRGTYETELSFFVDRRQDGAIEVFETSAEDGTTLHLVSVPVVLVP
jgi:hypothetical protein